MTLGQVLTRVLAGGIISHRLARARVNAAAHEAAWLRVRARSRARSRVRGLGLGMRVRLREGSGRGVSLA